jgi:hypothetical protein
VEHRVGDPEGDVFVHLDERSIRSLVTSTREIEEL